jgi:TfoX/Sxy family transcriptional regulator of competence genes
MNKNNLRENRKNVSRKYGLSPSDFNSYSNNKEYNSTPSNRFYTEKEEVTLRFYQVPKALFKNARYRGLSLGPKLMYSILRDRLNVSIKNNWKDENGFIYLIFSVEELMNLLDMSNKIIIKYKKMLAEYDLIFEKRLGQGRANRIYILKPELQEYKKCRKYTSKNGKNTSLEVSKVI